jgi:EpsD family peptidyl-prolyl cis-trans isomerase
MPTTFKRLAPRKPHGSRSRPAGPRWLVLAFGAAAFSFALSAHSALSASPPSAAAPVPSPVVATVDGEPITLQTVQAMLWRMSQGRPANAPVTQAQALEQLIDLKLQARQAQLQGVDALPIINELVAITRLEVLAKGLSDVKRQLQVQPTDEQVKDYYERSPHLFSQRKIFALQELVLEKTPLTEAALQSQVAKASDMKALTAAMDEAGVVYKLSAVTQPAENLPLDALPDIAAAPEGKPQWRRGLNGSASVFVVLASRSQPRSFEEAAPLIRLFLSNKSWMDESGRYVGELRQKALIERKPLPSPNGDFTFGR